MKIKETQLILKDLLKKVEYPRLGTVIGFQESVGQLSKCIMDLEIYNRQIHNENLEKTCANIFFSLMDICNAYGIDLEKTSSERLEAIRERVRQWESEHKKELEQKREKLD